jgi:hypothetical protein
VKLVSFFSTNVIRNVSRSKRIDRDVIETEYLSSIKVLFILLIEFSRQILEKNTQISNFMKIRPEGAVLFNAEEQT